MKVAYVCLPAVTASYKLGRMILPQLEQGTHGVEVVGMFYFDDNIRPSRSVPTIQLVALLGDPLLPGAGQPRSAGSGPNRPNTQTTTSNCRKPLALQRVPIVPALLHRAFVGKLLSGGVKATWMHPNPLGDLAHG